MLTTKNALCIITLSITLIANPAMANENTVQTAQHFAAKSAPDTNTAMCNLAQFNTILSKVTSADKIDPVAMVKVHELTYTLENALARLKITLEETAIALEEVHLASERFDESVVKSQSAAYLSLLSSLQATCQR